MYRYVTVSGCVLILFIYFYYYYYCIYIEYLDYCHANNITTDELNPTHTPTATLLKEAATARLKLHTIRYAKKQLKWLRNKFLPQCHRRNISIISVNTCDIPLQSTGSCSSSCSCSSVGNKGNKGSNGGNGGCDSVGSLEVRS